MQVSSEELNNMVTEFIKNVLADWGMEADVKSDTRLIDDLGFSSMDIIDTLASLEMRLKQKFPYEELVMVGQNQYREDITVQEIVVFAHKYCSGKATRFGS